jgi:DNA-binding protein WhiA
VYHVEAELLVSRKMNLRKNYNYAVRLKGGSHRVLTDLSILQNDQLHLSHQISADIWERQPLLRSYLRGAFLAGGSVNNPETSRYHLEIYSTYADHSADLLKVMHQFHLNAKETQRRSGFIVYLKEAEQVADFLQLIGATNAMLQFEDVRIVRDMRNSVNRLVNCETANMNKTVNAAAKQIDNIEYIQATVGLNQLSPSLREIAVVRLANPEVSLKELGEMLPNGPVSKSGVNHRLRKINTFAESLRQGDRKEA